MPLAHGTLPRAQPIWSETNVTEFGWNPDSADTGTTVGDGDGVDDGSGLGAGVTTADADEVGLPDGAGVDEQALSSRHSDPAPASRGRQGRNVGVINARNVSLGGEVTTHGSWFHVPISICAEPVTVSAPSTNGIRLPSRAC